MAWMVDLAYLLAALITAPFWLTRMIRTGKIRTDWAGRLGGGPALAAPDRPRLLLHAVSVGEVNAVRLLVDALARGEEAPEIVIASTTDTGFARAASLFGEGHSVVRYPFDFSFAVWRFLRRVRPTVVALVELEVWPNFTAACARDRIPVGVINGRLTRRSAARYRCIAPLVSRSFRRLAFACVQDEEYARRFRQIGVEPERIQVTGTMKWDTAQIADRVEGADDLARELGIDRTRRLVVAGSTAPDEHALLSAAVPEGVQLLCAPRKPEWFDQAAADLPGCARRSRGERGSSTGRFLLDTIGELRLAYALADVVIVGRSFGNLHGSDMMEPVALGKPTIVGPAVGDFQATVDALLAGDGLVQTDRDGLAETVAALLDDPSRRAQLAANGRGVIRRHQGATARHVGLLLQLLQTPATEHGS
jgi:3-deoxy-D-manno-octulosonic-acid transferase